VREIETEVSIPDPEDPPRMAARFTVTAAAVLLLGTFLLGVLAQLAYPDP
jgi:hypothetical protein